ncbi:hypothetical protein LTT66_27685 [Nocardia gipuzkoensis]|uniref:hypothetical protein n=1 Tax=Nocardia gipuzkoensis TaxID=2749991 RepID=UPI001E4B7954|nr:hypothetical protein [Nocardia gipuzkoensis]UGT67000.1 hypothetical protein LTT66_27685 [Nocardia gipuzkoensis]
MTVGIEQYREMFSEEIPVRAPDSEVKPLSLRGSMNGHGDWCVRLSDGGAGEWEGDGHDVFDAFAVVRSEHESRGFHFLVVGARPVRLTKALITHGDLSALITVSTGRSMCFWSPRRKPRLLIPPFPN